MRPKSANNEPLLVKYSWTSEELSHTDALSAHPALHELAYAEEPLNPHLTFVYDDARLSSTTHDGAQHHDIKLADHPLLLRSYATDVPTAMVELGIGDGSIKRTNTFNRFGVTVLDVITSIHEQ